jgi:hypothetical protein
MREALMDAAPAAVTPANPPWRAFVEHRPTCTNRLLAVMEHIPIYTIEGPTRLAADAGLCRSTVWRIIHGERQPTYRVMYAVTKAIERKLGKRIDPRDLVSFDGHYPTPSVCALVGCKGCLPTHFYNDEEELKPEYRHVRPGEWSLTPEYLPTREVAI